MFRSSRINNKNRLQIQNSGQLDSLDMLGGISYFGYAINGNYELTTNDSIIGVDTSGGPVTITVPDATPIDRNFFWQIYKITPDINPVTIQLADPTQAFSPSYASFDLLTIGSGIEVKLFGAANLYWYNDVGAVQLDSLPQVVTDKPVFAGNDLVITGELISLGSYSSVTAEFRYRKVGDPGFTTVGTQVLTVTGTFTHTEVGVLPPAADFEVQAIIRTPDGQTVTGSIRTTSINFYESAADATADGLIRYWDLQETGGGPPFPTGFPTLVNGVEKFATGEDLVFFNNCDVDIDTISGQSIYKRRLGNQGYGEAPFILNAGQAYTVLLQVKPTIFSGDHTVLNFGTNILSLGVDGTGLQLEVNGPIFTWVNASTYFTASSMATICVTVNPTAGTTNLRSVDTVSGAIVRATASSIPAAPGIWTRVGRGAPGDANHQDNEYLGSNASPGLVRSLAVWDRNLLDSELEQVVATLDTDGGLLF